MQKIDHYVAYFSSTVEISIFRSLHYFNSNLHDVGFNFNQKSVILEIKTKYFEQNQKPNTVSNYISRLHYSFSFCYTPFYTY